MKVSDFLVSELVRLGVKRVYTLPGGYSMHLNDSIAHSALTPVYMLHESAAGFAAIGEAQITGGLGVAIVTSGPGAMNILTAVTSAFQDSIPLLVISGDVNLAELDARDKYQLRQGGGQDAPVMKMVRPITKSIYLLTSPLFIERYINKLITEALAPRRGPVWLVVPLDVQAMECVE